jgi:polysaccharide export outer membrane protein
VISLRGNRTSVSISALALMAACCCGMFAQAAQSQVGTTPPAPRALGSNLPPTGARIPQMYKIGVDDILTISVWHEPDLSRTVPVRPDGRISLPLVGEVQAAGNTATALEDQLKTALAKFVKDPELTVMVAEIRSQRVNVIGEVSHPGTFPLTQSTGVLDALAWAGGLREFAKKNKIYVLRTYADGRRVRMNYDYKSVLQGKKGAQDIMLQANDTVVVP